MLRGVLPRRRTLGRLRASCLRGARLALLGNALLRLRRLAAPDAMPPFLPNSLASLSLRWSMGIRFFSFGIVTTSR